MKSDGWLERKVTENLTCGTVPELRAMDQGNSNLSNWWLRTLQRLPNIYQFIKLSSAL